jgi:nickel/cobalt transporter (NicO) family protein
MASSLGYLISTAALVGLVHTVASPNHYLPFTFIGKARHWSIFKTLSITALCSLGHIGSSIVLGLLGVFFGLGINQLISHEAAHINWEAIAFLAFGLIYFFWGLWKAIKNKPHKHVHIQGESIDDLNEHFHGSDSHVHKDGKIHRLTPWFLFLLFLFGPCDSLIPLLMYTASDVNIMGTILIVIVFALVTMLAMMSLVALLSYGVNLLPLGKLERYSYAIAGATIVLSGIAIMIFEHQHG